MWPWNQDSSALVGELLKYGLESRASTRFSIDQWHFCRTHIYLFSLPHLASCQPILLRFQLDKWERPVKLLIELLRFMLRTYSSPLVRICQEFPFHLFSFLYQQ